MRPAYLWHMRISLLLQVLLLVALHACQPAPDGARLSQQYCGSCHQYPEPGLLDRSTWERHVLPRMGYMLGIYTDTTERMALFEAGDAGRRVRAAGIFPAQPMLGEAEWRAICDHYLRAAPDTLALPAMTRPTDSLPFFRPRIPALRLSPPSTTLVDARDPWVGDAHTEALYRLDAVGRTVAAARVREGAVHLHASATGYEVLVMGSFSPTDQASGFLLHLPGVAGGQTRVRIDSLQRPVHAAYADLDGDSLEDVVICEYGKWTGRLAWWQAQPDGSYRPQVLLPRAGTIRTEITDLDRDGLPDLLVLLGQGDEGIMHFRNLGQGRFQGQWLLRFPASYGSSFFARCDWNDDGYPDLLYTAGDNADYPPLLKPYHGVYVFVNDGRGRFSQAFFYHLPGAYGASLHDFDQDGLRDLALISFFPDYARTPERGFVWLRGRGQGQFDAYTMPEAVAGRWLVMDSADSDGDGDTDLMLGSLAFEVVPPGQWVQQWTRAGIPFLWLENLAK
ncbi:MAG: hypothetical protein OHK0039_03550 [Bacteroidia bacterium]